MGFPLLQRDKFKGNNTYSIGGVDKMQLKEMFMMLFLGFIGWALCGASWIPFALISLSAYLTGSRLKKGL